MSYVKFFITGLLYLIGFILPFILFVIVQAKVNTYFEKGLSKAFFNTENVNKVNNHTLGNIMYRYISFTGIWLHELFFWIAGWLCGFIPSSFSVFTDDLKAKKNVGYKSLANVSLNYRSASNSGNKLVRFINTLFRIISKLFGCIPFVAPIIAIAWIYRYVLVHYTYSLGWMTSGAYFKDASFMQSISTFINYLVWAYAEIVKSPVIFIVFMVLSLFLSYGLTMSAYDRQQAISQSAFTIIVMYGVILYRMASYQSIAPFCNQIILVSLIIFPLIILSELLWIVIFNLINSFKFVGKHDENNNQLINNDISDNKAENLMATKREQKTNTDNKTNLSKQLLKDCHDNNLLH